MRKTMRQYQQNKECQKIQMVLHAVFVKAIEPTITKDPAVVFQSELFKVHFSLLGNDVNNFLALSMHMNIMDLGGYYIIYSCYKP